MATRPRHLLEVDRKGEESSDLVEEEGEESSDLVEGEVEEEHSQGVEM